MRSLKYILHNLEFGLRSVELEIFDISCRMKQLCTYMLKDSYY